MEVDNDTVRCLPTGEKSWVSFAANGVATACFVVFGLCGSLYSQQKLRRANQTAARLVRYLIVLSCWDIALLVSTFGFYGLATLLSGGVKPWNGPFTYCYIVFYPLVNLTMTGSVWMVLAISVERYLAISQPFKHSARKVRSTTYICLLVLLGTAVVSAPAMFELQIVQCWDFKNERWLPQIGQSMLRQDKLFLLLYRVICYLLFLSPVPFFIVFLVTARTLCIRYSLLSSSQSEDSMGGKAAKCSSVTRRDRTATLLTLMIIKFLFCYTGPTLVNILELTENQLIRQAFFTYIIDFSNLLVVTHSATNWLIFSRWQRTEKPDMTLVYKKQWLSKRQIKALEVLWENCNQEDVGRGILMAAVNANPHLLRHFTGLKNPELKNLQNNSNSTRWEKELQTLVSANERFKSHSLVVSAVLNDILDALISGSDKLAIIAKLRSVGHTHFIYGINLRHSEWQAVKDFLAFKLVERFAHPTSFQQFVARKFATFAVDEIKIGFICGIEDVPTARRQTNAV